MVQIIKLNLEPHSWSRLILNFFYLGLKTAHRSNLTGIILRRDKPQDRAVSLRLPFRAKTWKRSVEIILALDMGNLRIKQCLTIRTFVDCYEYTLDDFIVSLSCRKKNDYCTR